MTAVKATYKDGEVKLESQPDVKGTWEAVLTLIDEKTEKNSEGETSEKKHNLLDELSWRKTRRILKNYKGTPLSQVVIEERNEDRF